MLHTIKKEDLIFEDTLGDGDCTNTFLTLNDYDWMTYILKTKFVTKELGKLHITFEYMGMTDSFMNVFQQLDGENTNLRYGFSSDIFKKNLIRFLTAHIQSWDEANAFDGEDYVVDFYNDVIENGILTSNVSLYE